MSKKPEEFNFRTPDKSVWWVSSMEKPIGRPQLAEKPFNPEDYLEKKNPKDYISEDRKQWKTLSERWDMKQ